MPKDNDSVRVGKLMADVQWRTDLTEAQQKLYRGAAEALSKMPGAKIREQVLYLEKQILPAIARKKDGIGSADYIFFSGLIDSLKWTLIMYDRMEALMRKDSLLHLEATILRERVEMYERELQRYTTLEDLHLTDFLDRYDSGVLDRIKDVLQAKKR